MTLKQIIINGNKTAYYINKFGNVFRNKRGILKPIKPFLNNSPSKVKNYAYKRKTTGVNIYVEKEMRFYSISYLILSAYSTSKPGWRCRHITGESDCLNNLRWKIDILDELTEEEYNRWKIQLKYTMDIPRLHNRLQHEYAKNYKWFKDDPEKREQFFKKMFE